MDKDNPNERSENKFKGFPRVVDENYESSLYQDSNKTEEIVKKEKAGKKVLLLFPKLH